MRLNRSASWSMNEKKRRIKIGVKNGIRYGLVVKIPGEKQKQNVLRLTVHLCGPGSLHLNYIITHCGQAVQFSELNLFI